MKAYACLYEQCYSHTWKQALGQGLRGSVEPIRLTTLRVDPCGLFCQIGITS